MKFLILILSICPLLFTQAEYTKLQWTDCGSREVTFYDIALQPMPIIQPGTGSINLKMQLKRDLSGNLKTILTIVRTVSGIALPIRCYLAAGIEVGSCTYPDICAIIKSLLPESFNPSVCPPELAVYGIDCTCPFAIKGQLIEINDISLEYPDASTSIATFLASGDFDIKIVTSDAKGPVGCINIKFTVKPANSG